MNPVRASLRFPQVTIALTIMLVITGAYALMRMPRRLLTATLRDIPGLRAIGIPWAAVTAGMRDTGLDRLMRALTG